MFAKSNGFGSDGGFVLLGEESRTSAGFSTCFLYSRSVESGQGDDEDEQDQRDRVASGPQSELSG